MANFVKKTVSRDDVIKLHEKYALSMLEASIFARRGIVEGQDVMYFLENDLRFMHEPFLFNNMEDAVDRIICAKEEGEKVLIFGDKDVDGITSTAILYSYLKDIGIDVQWRLPVGEDSYGLSIQAIDDFAKDYGSLIITVDCGISNNKEIDYANSLGLDVIVTDHHNPPEELPNASIIIDPKIDNSGYTFTEISGAAVAFKLVSALRFSKFELYQQDLCLMDVHPEADGKITVNCLKTRNLVPKKSFSQSFYPGETSISNTKLPDFLRGQQIFVWNSKEVTGYLRQIFGSAVEFQVMDMQTEISKTIPFVKGKDLSSIKSISKIAKYSSKPATELEGFYNIFVTWAHKQADILFPKQAQDRLLDLELVGIAALADIMPMKNENRIFVKAGLEELNHGKKRSGLAELMGRLDLGGKVISSTDLSWKLIPALNAAGRMGMSNLALELLISEDALERDRLAQKIIELNEQRKVFVQDAEFYTTNMAKESFTNLNNKLCIVCDKRINRGVTGILAAKIMQKYNVPAMALTFTEDGSVAVGSMRSCRGFVATTFLDSFGDFFINHGGHNAAAGFSFESSKLDQFMSIAKNLSQTINLTEDSNKIEIDAELPQEYISPDLLKIVEKMEPYGEANAELVFMSKELKVQDAVAVGKSERQHLKLTFDCGKYKFPAMFWGEAERLNRDFKVGDKLDIVYNIGKNTFNGNTTPQMLLLDLNK